ncbi:ribonuclease H, partial [Trifolium pratense]
MVERLKEHIPKLVSPFQAGFVPGRNIHENIIFGQEMIHSMHHMKGKKAYFAIKVDLSKAYDKLNWEFIWRILNEIGIPQKMMNVIMHSVTSVETNVKWNGARADFFRPQRGIRQVDIGEWKAIRAGRNGPVISHLIISGQQVSQEKTSIYFSKNASRAVRDSGGLGLADLLLRLRSFPPPSRDYGHDELMGV